MLDDRIQRTPITEDDWCLGVPTAAVTILEYGDFECPYCAAARPVLEGLVEEEPDTIRLVYRHFPIATIHPHATLAAEAAEAAGAQGRFWDMHDTLFTHQRALEYEDLRAYAAMIGLDVARFDREIMAHLYLPEVKADFRHGITDGVNGTPTLFINGHRYDGPRERSAILAAVSELVARRG
ncbi:MAG TPA: thioredoxin domain-containing protein [Longimicrobiales bacterium]|nr:thioredoxin domain-containing protein [Longimicrobiales bacterium]